ncbi:hypothetical protein [Schaalia sp. ZJ1691]|nr:hypothetical protein [Schaalia sp. ZJ1691]
MNTNAELAGQIEKLTFGAHRHIGESTDRQISARTTARVIQPGCMQVTK